MTFRQTDSPQCTRKSQSVNKPEQKCDQRRPAARESALTMQGFGRDQNDGERDRGLDRWRAQREPAQGAERQSEAVSRCKGGNRQQEPSVEPHQEEDREHKQQVIESGQNVLDSE